MIRYKLLIVPVVFVFVFECCTNPKQTENEANSQNEAYLQSWNEGATKQSIIDFVRKTTTEGSTDFLPVSERIACFDNDGTLWSEQPMYFQLAYAIDRIKTVAPQHPEWKTKQPYKALLEGDLKTVLAGGEHTLLEIVMATHAGMTTDEFSTIAKDWIGTTKHPKTGKRYKDMVFKPMLELLD